MCPTRVEFTYHYSLTSLPKTIFLNRERREVPPPQRAQARRASGLDRSISLREKSPKIEDREKAAARGDTDRGTEPDHDRGSRSTKLPKRVINRRRSNSVGSGGSGDFNKIKEKLERRKEASPKRNAKWELPDYDSKEITEFAKVKIKI